jgi:hypothetical protein
MEKLAAAVAATQGDSAKIAKISDSLAKLQGNQGKPTVAVNRPQSERMQHRHRERQLQHGLGCAGQHWRRHHTCCTTRPQAAFPNLRWFGGPTSVAEPVWPVLSDTGDTGGGESLSRHLLHVWLCHTVVRATRTESRLTIMAGLRQARQPAVWSAAQQQPTWWADSTSPRDHSGGIPEPIFGAAVTLRRLGGEASGPHLHIQPRQPLAHRCRARAPDHARWRHGVGSYLRAAADHEWGLYEAHLHVAHKPCF